MDAPEEPRHRNYGTRLSEWIRLTPNELAIDAVGLWQVVRGLKLGYGLSGTDLEEAVRVSIASLLAVGGRPVQGDNGDKQWHLRSDLAQPEEEALDRIMEYWRGLGRDPDVGDIWFARPEMFEERR